MSALVQIPLDRLMLSSLNVRQTERDADIAGLAEAIAAKGLKQNLVAIPAHFTTAVGAEEVTEGDWDDRFEVTAGGRRLQAMQLLAADGRLPGDFPVPCMIEAREEARETSLDENLHKIAMNPADEFDAFMHIVAERAAAGDDRGAAIAYCAKRYGKTVGYVEGRLRLAGLAPEILDALRAGRIGMDAAKAYAAVSDHKLQLAVFKEREKDSWHGHKPSTIRERLRGKTIGLKDRRVTYVGLDAYLAAGGRTEVEMFMGETGEERLIDVGKLDKMVRDKAEAAIPAKVKKDGFKEGLYATPGTWGDPNWPKPPKGFERAYSYYGTKPPTKAQLKKSIGVYTVAGRFKPTTEKSASPGDSYRPKTEEEIAAERREHAIATIAARLAVGPFAGSPFEGRAYWPANNNRWIDPIEQVNDTEVLVVVQVKVTTADIDAQREAATAKYDAELAEAEAEKLRQAKASADEHGVELEDVVDDMGDEELDEVGED
jgi:ParB family chromosome partitioning protein